MPETIFNHLKARLNTGKIFSFFFSFNFKKEQNRAKTPGKKIKAGLSAGKKYENNYSQLISFFA